MFEHADIGDLAPVRALLRPNSIALLGATSDRSKLRGRITEYLMHGGYRGKIFLVNPSHEEIAGHPCHRSVLEIEDELDLAIVVVPAQSVVKTVKECAQARVKATIIMSSGFAEEGPQQAGAQAEISEIARQTGMRICGPNSEGFFSPAHGIAATFSPTVETTPDPSLLLSSKKVGVIAQSGGVGFALYNRGLRAGLQFSDVVTVGNECDLTVSDFLHYMVEDPQTSVIALFLEEIRDPARFLQAAHLALRHNKPIIAIKVGRSTEGKQATASHTGAMSGSNEAYEAAFRTLGIIVVNDLEEAIGAATLLVACPLPAGRRIGVVTVSGGAGALVTDALIDAGLTVPALPTTIQNSIRQMIPSYGATRNPVDVTGQATRTGAPIAVIDILQQDEDVDIVVAVMTVSNESRPPVDPEKLRELVAAQHKPIVFYSYTHPSDLGLRSLLGSGAPLFLSAGGLARSLSSIADYVELRDVAASHTFADRTLGDPAAEGLSLLSEHRSKALLSSVGIPVPTSVLVRTKSELRDVQEHLSFPVVAKVQSPDIPHKSDVGGVVLDIPSMTELIGVYDHMLRTMASARPDAELEGILIEEAAPRGVEVIVGCVVDESFGSITTIGIGGTHVEIMGDVSRRLSPVSDVEVRAMLHELKGYPLLTGFRGSPPVDLDALIDLICKVSRFAAEQGEIREVELNPVLATPDGCLALDAMIVMHQAAADSANAAMDR